MPDGLTALAAWSAALVAVAGALALLWRATRGLRQTIHRAELFWEDWAGSEERPGVARRPGVMERLDWIEHQLKPNSGSSMRDAVNRIEDAVSATPKK